MKYICIWGDNCGVIQALEFTSDSDNQALTGIIGRCREEYIVSDSDTIRDELLAVPKMMIREDFTRFNLGLVPDSTGLNIISAYKID
jgi:hypothetical protein